MSYRIEDQTSDDWDKDEVCWSAESPGHRMVSIKVDSPAVPFIERCEVCGFIEASALTLHAENWAKMVLPRRAQRIAVAVQGDPFRFVQPPSGELALVEILAQAFAAMSHHSAALGVTGNASTGQRETAILKATLAEVERLIGMGRADADQR